VGNPPTETPLGTNVTARNWTTNFGGNTSGISILGTSSGNPHEEKTWGSCWGGGGNPFEGRTCGTHLEEDLWGKSSVSLCGTQFWELNWDHSLGDAPGGHPVRDNSWGTTLGEPFLGPPLEDHPWVTKLVGHLKDPAWGTPCGGTPWETPFGDPFWDPFGKLTWGTLPGGPPWGILRELPLEDPRGTPSGNFPGDNPLGALADPVWNPPGEPTWGHLWGTPWLPHGGTVLGDHPRATTRGVPQLGQQTCWVFQCHRALLVHIVKFVG
jgi:hypothetical protein